jgi:hypothetical protein
VSSENTELTCEKKATATIRFVLPDSNIFGFDTNGQPFETGQPVIYTLNTGSTSLDSGNNGKLVSNNKYYVRRLKTIVTPTIPATDSPIANPGVITLANHGLQDGTRVIYRNGGGTSITGLTSGSTYYVILGDASNANTTSKFRLAASYAHAIAADPSANDIAFTGAGNDAQFFEIPDCVKLYDTEANAIAGTSTGLIDFAGTGSANNANVHTIAGLHGPANYIADGKYVYGWFRGKVGTNNVTVFGELYREGTLYYFTVLDNYSATVILTGGQKFLPDLNYNADGKRQPVTLIETSNYTEKEGLSSVNVAPKTIVPIPETGTNVATIYLQPGTEQIDLNTYFDYNKEYLSYPLTDEADTLYFSVDSDTVASDSDKDSISLGVTWEEQ